MKGYKLFRVKKDQPGKLFPMFVLTEKAVPVGCWVDAEEGPRIGRGDKVASKIGALKFRPGWHLSDIPLAVHIGIREKGVIKYMHPDTVWCECEFSDEIDYQHEADAAGKRKGKIIPVRAMLNYIPVNGFYRYKTNPQMLGKWIIAGRMKVERILSDAEVDMACKAAGYAGMPRKTPLILSDYGL